MVGYPLRLRPRFDQKIWGGRRLESVLRKSLPPNVPVGESLESGDDAVVDNGRLAGRSLGELARQAGPALLGRRGLLASQPFGDFPLLAKFIDAEQTLSLQVHPDDPRARGRDKRGKTEAWYVVSAEPGATLISGVVEQASPQLIERSLADGSFESLLCYEPVRPGDTLLVPAGTVHAIGAGVLLYEIQENSDLTYRLYDWGRLDPSGQPRPLHLDDALTVLRPGQCARRTPALRRSPGSEVLAACRYFTLERWSVDGERALDSCPASFRLVSCLDGAATIVVANQEPVSLDCGQTVLLPADLEAGRVSGSATLLCSWIADLRTEVIEPLLDAGYDLALILRLDGGTGDLARASLRDALPAS